MTKYRYALLAAGALFATGAFAVTDPARAADVTLSFQIGDVAFGYHDGYYDRHRRWHRWSSDAERDWYRRHYGPTYYPVYRDRDRDRYRLDWRTGRRAYWYGDGGGADFALVLGNVVFAYDDGYYDRDRRWYPWPSPRHRDWYRLNRRDTFFAMRRDYDRDRYRRDWWEGRRSDWRYYGQGGYDRGGPDFTIVLGNVAFAYSDGYYDRDRRWHTWRSDSEREWYRRHYSRTYYDYARDREISRARQEWRERRQPDWYDMDNDGHDTDGDGYDEDDSYGRN